MNSIPEDINVELLLSYFSERKCKVRVRGLHKRNAYSDIVDVEEKKDGSLVFGVGRQSIYNSLPEVMFHPIERFGSLANKEGEKKFIEEYEKQEEEKEDAYQFFAPIDLLLLRLRVWVRERLMLYTSDNKVLLDILGDSLTEAQKANRFIRQAVPFMPSFKSIRGDRTLLTLMLRKIFMEEGLRIDIRREMKMYEDPAPRYADGLDADLGEGYVGNVYDEMTTIYDIHYWSDEDCDEHFLQFLDDVEVFRLFVQDYLMSVEEILRFDIYKDDAALRLSDEIRYNYLNYNTNL